MAFLARKVLKIRRSANIPVYWVCNLALGSNRD